MGSLMRLVEHLFINTFDKASLPMARRMGLGLEIEEYLWTYTKEEVAARRESVPRLMAGFSRFTFHGTAVSRNVVGINKLSDEELLSIYNESWRHACFHGIDRIVFHSNYLAAMESQSTWIEHKTDFWRAFLEDKPSCLNVYIENFVDDTPDLLAQLCDTVDDPRFQICLDVGHAGCNSSIDLTTWIDMMGRRIGHVHLHNNDGFTDKHWPLGQGVLNVAQIIEQLTGYTGAAAFILECNLEESLRWLRQNGFLTCADEDDGKDNEITHP